MIDILIDVNCLIITIIGLMALGYLIVKKVNPFGLGEEIDYRIEVFRYNHFEKEPNVTGHTGMSYIKMFTPLVVIAFCIMFYFALPYLTLHHAKPVSEPGFTEGILAGNGSFSMSIMPMAHAENVIVPTDTPTVTPYPSPTSYPVSTPTVNPADLLPGGSLNPLPTAYIYTPTPTITPPTANNQYIDSNDFVKVNGLNTNYVIPSSRALNPGQSVSLGMTFTNMEGTPISSISGVLTAAYTIKDPTGLGFDRPNTYTENLDIADNIDLTQYQSFTYSGATYTIPAGTPPGTILVQANIHGNNGASCSISELITVN